MPENVPDPLPEAPTDTHDPYRRRRIAAMVGAVAAAIATLLLLALIFGIWPFGGSNALTRAQFLTKGDAICKSAQADFAQVQKTTPETTAPQAAVLTGKLIDISEAEFNKINDLEPPTDMQEAVDAYLVARQKGIDLLQEGYDAAQNDDVHAYQRAKDDLVSTQKQRQKLAKAVGFTECSQVVVDPGTGEPTASAP